MSHVEHVSIESFAKSAYLAYAMKVVKDRAIPDVEDGIKPVQRRILFAMQQLKLLGTGVKPMKCARVVGDCFVKGALVHGQNGLRPIEDVEVGEYVWTPKGQLSRVVECFHNSPSKVVNIDFGNGKSLTTTPGQLFRVVNEDFSISWCAASDLAGKTVLIANQIASNEGPILKKEILDLGYVIGLLVAEGYLADRGRSRRVGISMVEAEPIEFIERYCQAVGIQARRSLRRQNTNHQVQHVLRFSGLDAAFACCENLCDKKEVPTWILSQRSMFAPFLAGLFDGDGYFREDRKEAVYTTTSPSLARQVMSMLADMGIDSSLMKTERAPNHHKDLFQILITGKSFPVLGNALFPWLTVSSKKERVAKSLSKEWRYEASHSEQIDARLVWEEFSRSDLGGGWFKDVDGNNFRQGITYKAGQKIRYHADLKDSYLSYDRIRDWGIREKLKRLGSPLFEKLSALMSYYKMVEVSSVNNVDELVETFDIQIDHEDHEFIVEGFAVHNCIGKYHPHGDSAVYEAMVRMAQPFSLRYPLVDGQGNFGSRDGDSAAAMRYTEARLTPIAAALLDELAWATVDYKPTYDNSHEEPVTLPSRLPFLLLNGSYGIAVGMATNLLPHNLLEVVEAAKVLLSKPKAKFEEVMEHITGPDFPTGGKLISSREEILKTYMEGRGSLRLRSQWIVEPVGKSWRLVITELPQDTSTAKIMMAMDELIDPKAPEKAGKKQPLKPEQLRLKKMFGDMIDNYVDGSDKDNPVRLVIDPKDRKMNPEVLAMALCAHTDMEMNVSPNFVCVDTLGNPRQGGMVDWLRQWCEYRVETVRRRLTDEKSRVDRRLHLLAGRLSILDRIEEVIRVLKKSVEPKKDLMEQFGLDEIQAEDVLEMRLRQLANLEKNKILEERAKLLLEQDRLAKLLGDEKLMRKLIIKEMDADAKAFGDARRTEIAPSEATNAKKQTDSLVIERLSPEPIAIVLTERGWLGWRPAKTFEEAKDADYKVKAGDSIRRMWLGDRNADHAVFMDETGRAYSFKLTDLPSKADMMPLTTWFDPQARIVEGALSGHANQWIVMGNSGYGFVVKGSDWINRMKAGKAFLTLGEKDRPLPPIPVPEGTAPDTSVLVLSTDGRAVGFPLADVKVLPKGKGVGLIGLAGEHVVSDAALVQEGVALKTAKGTKANLPADLSSWIGTRSSGKKGKALHKQSEGAIFMRPGREIDYV